MRETRVTETHTDETSEKAVKELGKSLKDMPRSFWILVKNPAFLFITLAGTFEGFSTSGMATFLPKLIQNQFGTSAAWAAILGGIAIPSWFLQQIFLFIFAQLSMQQTRCCLRIDCQSFPHYINIFDTVNLASCA